MPLGMSAYALAKALRMPVNRMTAILPSPACGDELVGRELGERAGAAICRVHELDHIGIGRLEDAHDGAAVAARKPCSRTSWHNRTRSRLR